ncbi:hypothetical protein GGI15_002684 [Coemansia interrupta]|uniref:Rab-GAP TBC domain-containing protein n=1 Tax=Coemansia interrupta TaxID=1126814 RepID=A0A9W8LKR1_9FUNG|nr:hypothetical protein GGI15_002684 [Coemansia interrupta]
MHTTRPGASDATRRRRRRSVRNALTRTRSAGDLGRCSSHAAARLPRHASLPALRTHPPSPRSRPDATPTDRHPSPPAVPRSQPPTPSARPGALQLRRRTGSALSIATTGKPTLHLPLPPFLPTLSPACTSFAHAEATAAGPGGGRTPPPASWSPAVATAHGMLCRLAGVASVSPAEHPVSCVEWTRLVEEALGGRREARVRVRRLARAVAVAPEARPALWAALAQGVETAEDTMGLPVEDIDLDVLRTADDPRVVGSLRHVLHSYCHARPATGYCQGMDKIAHALLRALGAPTQASAAATALHVFHLLLDRILPPDMFHAPLARLMDDQRVLACLVARRLPRLAHHLHLLDASLAPVTFSWFATLFAGVLPDPLLWRLWDVVLVEHCYAPVFEAALVVLAVVERELVACVVAEQVYGVLQGAGVRAGEMGDRVFARRAFAEDGARVSMSEIEVIRCTLGIT